VLEKVRSPPLLGGGGGGRGTAIENGDFALCLMGRFVDLSNVVLWSPEKEILSSQKANKSERAEKEK